MPITDHLKVELVQLKYPASFLPLQHLVMAMADYQSVRGRTSWLGQPKWPKAYAALQNRLRDVLLAMMQEGIASGAHAGVFREGVVSRIEAFADAFPNWQDAYAYAHECLVIERKAAERQIDLLLSRCST